MKRSSASTNPGTSGRSSSPGGTGEPPTKRIVFEPLQLGRIANLDELEVIKLIVSSENKTNELCSSSKGQDASVSKPEAWTEVDPKSAD